MLATEKAVLQLKETGWELTEYPEHRLGPDDREKLLKMAESQTGTMKVGDTIQIYLSGPIEHY